MNKQQFVDGLLLGATHLNTLQDNIDASFSSVGKTLGEGILSGFEVSVVGDVLRIYPGVAIDSNGRILKSTEMVETQLIRPWKSNSYKYWCTFIIQYTANTYNEITDLQNQSLDFNVDDDYEIDVLISQEATNPVKPNVSQSQVVLLDFLIDNDTPYYQIECDSSRRIEIPTAIKNEAIIQQVQQDMSNKTTTFIDSDNPWTITISFTTNNTWINFKIKKPITICFSPSQNFSFGYVKLFAVCKGSNYTMLGLQQNRTYMFNPGLFAGQFDDGNDNITYPLVCYIHIVGAYGCSNVNDAIEML